MKTLTKINMFIAGMVYILALRTHTTGEDFSLVLSYITFLSFSWCIFTIYLVANTRRRINALRLVSKKSFLELAQGHSIGLVHKIMCLSLSVAMVIVSISLKDSEVLFYRDFCFYLGLLTAFLNLISYYMMARPFNHLGEQPNG